MTRSARGRRNDGAGVVDRMPPQRTEDESSTAAGAPESTRGGRLSRMWLSFLYDRSVRSRVGVLVLIPLLGALVLGSVLLYQAIERSAAASTLERDVRTTQVALDAIARLQDERDISGLY